MSGTPEFCRNRWCWLVVSGALGSSLAWGTDIIGIQPAAMDMPRVNAIVRYPKATGGMDRPLAAVDDWSGDSYFNIQAYYDTGASGVLISKETADLLGVPDGAGITRQTYSGQNVVFEDVGVAGSDQFHVSVPVYISIAKFHPDADTQIAAAEAEYTNSGTFSTINSVYTQSFGQLRTQIGITENPDPNLAGMDVFGMPLMKGKVVVMDPRPADTFADTMRTYSYNPGTAFNAATEKTEPGIPNTTRRVKLSYASFDAFTKVTPTGAPGPTLEHNPFIGPNPVAPAGDTTPPVTISYNGRSTDVSFLLDTGAAASMISKSAAGGLGLTVNETNPDNPYIVGVPLADQFTLTIGGVGGTKKVPGFYLSSLLLRTMEGGTSATDPKHLRFVDAPVLINDISVKNPTTGQTVTLGGIFGMNFLVGSASLIDSGLGFPFPADLTPGAFDWVVFDEPSGMLKLRPRLNGDANRDGIVSFADLATVAQHYGDLAQEDPWAEGDFNGDGMVTFADLAMVAQRYNNADLNAGDVIDLPHYEMPIFGAPVPEPGMGLLLAGALFILHPRRARSSAASPSSR